MKAAVTLMLAGAVLISAPGGATASDVRVTEFPDTIAAPAENGRPPMSGLRLVGVEGFQFDAESFEIETADPGVAFLGSQEPAVRPRDRQWREGALEFHAPIDLWDNAPDGDRRFRDGR